MTAPARILHAPHDVGGNAYGLSRAERELGLYSDVAVISGSGYGYGADIDLHAGNGQPVWRRLARRLAFLRRAVSEYDVFHFNFGDTLLTVRQFGVVRDELALLKGMGKRVLVTFQGCDVRPYERCFCRSQACLAHARYRAPAAARHVRFADRVLYLNPDLGDVLPGARFVPYASVDPRAVEPAPPADRDDVVIAHAPSDRDVKGTRHVEAAVDELTAEGLRVRLDLIEGVPHDEALRRLASADLVVDQLLLGWYGAVAVEAMALAKPVLCFIRDGGANPFGESLPLVRTSAGTLAAELRGLVADPDRRRDAGLAGRRFAEHHHDPRRIARSVLDGIVALPGAG